MRWSSAGPVLDLTSTREDEAQGASALSASSDPGHHQGASLAGLGTATCLNLHGGHKQTDFAATGNLDSTWLHLPAHTHQDKQQLGGC